MKYVKDILSKVEEATKPDADNAKETPSNFKLRSSLAGAAVGGIVGLMIAYSKKWNMFYGVLGGAVLGGLIANLFTPKG